MRGLEGRFGEDQLVDREEGDDSRLERTNLSPVRYCNLEKRYQLAQSFPITIHDFLAHLARAFLLL